MASIYVAPVNGTWARKSDSPFGASRDGGRRLHAGNDLQAKNGSTAVAAIGGTVIYTGHNQGYQYNAVIQGDDGNAFRYATHGPLNVTVGDRVEQGQPVGSIARDHLHFEVIPAASPAYADMVANFANPGANGPDFVKTSYYPGGKAVTIDPAAFFGIQKGARIAAGQPVGSAEASTLVAETQNDPFGIAGWQREREATTANAAIADLVAPAGDVAASPSPVDVAMGFAPAEPAPAAQTIDELLTGATADQVLAGGASSYGVLGSGAQGGGYDLSNAPTTPGRIPSPSTDPRRSLIDDLLTGRSEEEALAAGPPTDPRRAPIDEALTGRSVDEILAAGPPARPGGAPDASVVPAPVPRASGLPNPTPRPDINDPSLTFNAPPYAGGGPTSGAAPPPYDPLGSMAAGPDGMRAPVPEYDDPYEPIAVGESLPQPSLSPAEFTEALRANPFHNLNYMERPPTDIVSKESMNVGTDAGLFPKDYREQAPTDLPPDQKSYTPMVTLREEIEALHRKHAAEQEAYERSLAEPAPAQPSTFPARPEVPGALPAAPFESLVAGRPEAPGEPLADLRTLVAAKRGFALPHDMQNANWGETYEEDPTFLTDIGFYDEAPIAGMSPAQLSLDAMLGSDLSPGGSASGTVPVSTLGTSEPQPRTSPGWDYWTRTPDYDPLDSIQPTNDPEEDIFDRIISSEIGPVSTAAPPTAADDPYAAQRTSSQALVDLHLAIAERQGLIPATPRPPTVSLAGGPREQSSDAGSYNSDAFATAPADDIIGMGQGWWEPPPEPSYAGIPQGDYAGDIYDGGPTVANAATLTPDEIIGDDATADEFFGTSEWDALPGKTVGVMPEADPSAALGFTVPDPADAGLVAQPAPINYVRPPAPVAPAAVAAATVAAPPERRGIFGRLFGGGAPAGGQPGGFLRSLGGGSLSSNFGQTGSGKTPGGQSYTTGQTTQTIGGAPAGSHVVQWQGSGGGTITAVENPDGTYSHQYG